ncbi:MAG: nucleotide exchange factor GrpE [Ignavibacteriae bacterium]|nr:MAG: nucleotide exchange factor GrpE [Ignavibacteriota bacterium]
MLKSKKEKAENKNVKNDADEKNVTNETETGIKEETKDNERNKTDELQAQVNNLRDQLLRKAAEFENYKRRTDAEISSYLKYANENLLIDLLPVVDDFDRVMKSWDDKHDIETFKKGIEMIYDKFKKILNKQGLKEMDSEGKEFDVNLHDALLQTPNPEVPANTILETIEKGYYLKDKVIRHAKVVVSAKPDDDGGKE